MLRRNGVDVAVPVAPAVFLIAVEGRPSAFQPDKFRFRDKVPRLAVAAQLVVPYKRKLLAGPQLVHHPADAAADLILEGRIVRTCEREGEGGHIMPGAVALQFRGRGIPAVRLGVALCGQAIRIAVVIKLLGDIQGEKILYVQVTVGGEPVVADEPDAPERQRPGGRILRRRGGRARHHRHAGLDRKTVLCRIVAEDIALHGIGFSGRQSRLLFLGLPERIRPFDLAPFAGTVRIGDPYLVRQHRRRAFGGVDQDFLDLADGLFRVAGSQQQKGNGQQHKSAENTAKWHG